MCLVVVLRQVFVFFEFQPAQIAAKYLSQNNIFKTFPLCPIIPDFPYGPIEQRKCNNNNYCNGLGWNSTQLGPEFYDHCEIMKCRKVKNRTEYSFLSFE